MAGEPRTEAGRRLLERFDRAQAAPSDLSTEDYFHREATDWWREAVEPAIRAIEDEAVASEREFAWHANRSARAAIDAAIADIRRRHAPFEGRCDLCFLAWPCPDAALADGLAEVVGRG